MLTSYDSDLKTVKERSRSKFRGWVVSDLVGGSFRPIFRVSHFGLWLFGPKSESDNVCIIICVWMDRWAGVKFCEKNRLKCKKGPFTTQAPCQNGPSGAKMTCYHYSVTRGNQENLYRKQLKSIDFRTIQQHFLRQFPHNAFRYRIKNH